MDRANEQESKKWFVIQTRPNFEKKAAHFIKLKGVEVFLPLVLTIRKWSDRKKKIYIPMFSGYVFVNTADEERQEAIKEVPGAVRFIFFQGRPAEISGTEINNIKLSLKAPERFKVENSNIHKGDMVTVKNGVFEGMKGIVTEFRGNYKLTLNLTELSVALSIVLDTSEVKLLEKNNE